MRIAKCEMRIAKSEMRIAKGNCEKRIAGGGQISPCSFGTFDQLGPALKARLPQFAFRNSHSFSFVFQGDCGVDPGRSSRRNVARK